MRQNKLSLKDLDFRLNTMEQELRPLRLLLNDKNIAQLVGEISSIGTRVDTMERTETGRIRYEVQKMFKQVMTERDLFAFRIPIWARWTRKIKNTKI